MGTKLMKSIEQFLTVDILTRLRNNLRDALGMAVSLFNECLHFITNSVLAIKRLAIEILFPNGLLAPSACVVDQGPLRTPKTAAV